MRVMAGEELVVEAGGAVSELELAVRSGEVRESRRRLIQSSRTKVHRETSHLARTPKEWTPAHGCELLESPLLAPLVLEPHLKQQNIQKSVTPRAAVIVTQQACKR